MAALGLAMKEQHQDNRGENVSLPLEYVSMYSEFVSQQVNCVRDNKSQ